MSYYILVLHGPNLNLLGEREPDYYGTSTLGDINKQLKQQASSLGHRLDTFQNNVEGILVERIHSAKRDNVDFIIINPAAYTHTSIALRDAFSSVQIPFIEVHLSNVYAREAFRHTSYLSDVAVGVISGLGAKVYDLALQAAIHQLQDKKG